MINELRTSFDSSPMAVIGVLCLAFGLALLLSAAVRRRLAGDRLRWRDPGAEWSLRAGCDRSMAFLGCAIIVLGAMMALPDVVSAING